MFESSPQLATGSVAMGSSGSASSCRSSSGSGSYVGHTHVETDGRLGIKVEHHKDGQGNYTWNYAFKPNDGQVREKMGDQVLREKKGSNNANHKVGDSYKMSSGSYNLFTDNCQHASARAYDAADDFFCAIQ